jgi:hypothetical protein
LSANKSQNKCENRQEYVRYPEEQADKVRMVEEELIPSTSTTYDKL